MIKVKKEPRSSQDFADAIDGKQDEIVALAKRMTELREEWVKYMCPFKIGDLLVGNDYSFEGKIIQVEKVSVTERYTNATDYRCKWKWVAVGPIMNKDGSAGKNYTKRTMAVADVKIQELEKK